jgi:hypothetical protein
VHRLYVSYHRILAHSHKPVDDLSIYSKHAMSVCWGARDEVFYSPAAFMCDYGEALLHPTDLFMGCRIRLPKRRSRQVPARSRRTGGVVGVLADGAPDVDRRGDGASGAFQENDRMLHEVWGGEEPGIQARPRRSVEGHPSSYAEINGCHSLVKGHFRFVPGIQYTQRVALIVRVTLTPKGPVIWGRC